MRPLLIEKVRGGEPRYYIRYKLAGRKYEPGLTDRHGNRATPANVAVCFAWACSVIAQGHHPNPSKASYETAVEDYLAALPGEPFNNGPETIEGKRQCLAFVGKWLAGKEVVRLADVTDAMMLAYQRERSGLAKSSWRREAAYIKHFFKWCVTAELLNSSPAAGLTAKKPKHSSTFLKEPITEKQNEKLLAAMPPNVAAAWRYCVETGVRPKEMRTLRIRDLRLKESGASYVMGKTDKVRNVWYSPELAKALAALVKGRKEADFVFLSNAGTPWTRHTWRENVYRAAHAAKLMKWDATRGRIISGTPPNPHLVRHTAATKLAAAGYDVRDLMEIFGWDDMESALKYVRANKGKVLEAYAILQGKK
jgi:site-specific recombinase XerD